MKVRLWLKVILLDAFSLKIKHSQNQTLCIRNKHEYGKKNEEVETQAALSIESGKSTLDILATGRLRSFQSVRSKTFLL